MTNSSTTPASALSLIRKSHAPLREQVRDELREAIIAGRLEPGTRLIERGLIDMLGVSRTVVREALRQIEAEGLIAGDPKKGMVVRELTLIEAKHLYAIRGLLEGMAARLFVENADRAQLVMLEAALKATVDAYKRGEPKHILDTKNRFYVCLFDGAASDTLSSMLGMLHARIWRWRALGLSHPKRTAKRSVESVKGLRQLLDAIKKGDAEAAESIMREETARAAAEVMRLLERPATR